MGRKRKKGEYDWLPPRWKYTRGAFYYQVKPGMEEYWDGKKTFKLGNTYEQAHKVWVERTGKNKKIYTIAQLLENFAKDVIPTLAPKTQQAYISCIPILNKVFGSENKDLIKPKHIYQFYHKSTSKSLAKKQIAVLGSAYSYAVSCGDIDRHPFRGEVRLRNNPPRDRYIEDWEWEAALSLDPKDKKRWVAFIQAYMQVKLLIGLRKSDMLRIKISDMKEDGIHAQARKTGKEAPFSWTQNLREAVALARSVRPVDISPYLFCDSRGRCYVKDNGTTNNFDAIWQRFMKRVLAETTVEKHFTEHDIRAKTASDAESDERAQELMTHSNIEITKLVYRRKPVTIKPLK